jgi:heme exporter protein D
MMPGLGEHAGFIIAAYAITAVVVLGLVLWVYGDVSARKRELRELEAQGVTRRSAARRRKPETRAVPE